MNPSGIIQSITALGPQWQVCGLAAAVRIICLPKTTDKHPPQISKTFRLHSSALFPPALSGLVLHPLHHGKHTSVISVAAYKRFRCSSRAALAHADGSPCVTVADRGEPPRCAARAPSSAATVPFSAFSGDVGEAPFPDEAERRVRGCPVLRINGWDETGGRSLLLCEPLMQWQS